MVASLIVVLYVIVGVCVGVVGARRWVGEHPTYEDSKYADLATAGFLMFCLAAIWPLVLFFAGVGALVTAGKDRRL